MMGDPFQKLHSIAFRRRDIMQEISHHQWPTLSMEHIRYKWASTNNITLLGTDNYPKTTSDLG